MPQTINTNLTSLNAQRNLNASQLSLSTAMQRLSSGLRINSAKDDAAGLAIAERMNTQVRGMAVAMRNANDGISMSQVAEGALSKVGDALQRMRELSLQARNATNSQSDKESLQKEFKQLQSEINRVLSGTSFNSKRILGADAATFTFQIGANTTEDDVVQIGFTNLASNADIMSITDTIASIGSGVGITAIASVIANIDEAINRVNDTRAIYGATQSRFEAIISQ